MYGAKMPIELQHL